MQEITYCICILDYRRYLGDAHAGHDIFFSDIFSEDPFPAGACARGDKSD